MWRSVFIALVLAVHILLPAGYYRIGPFASLRGDDKYDERFSWRMFSAVRVEKCTATLFEKRHGSEKRVPIHQLVHQGWVTNIKRSRTQVAEALIQKRCEVKGVQRARIINICRTPSGQDLPPREWDLVCE